MGKPLPDDRLDVDPSSRKPDQQISELPPRIPPRMKKTKGPELPEKPAHIRAKSNNLLSSQQLQLPREPLKPRILNMEKSPCREVLVAACKAGRERPVDKRQREPPKLLKPTGGSTYRRDIAVPPGHLEESWRDVTTPRPSSAWRSDEYAAMSSLNSPLWPLNDGLVHGWSHKTSSRKPNCPVHQPMLVVPRHLITWGSTPVPHTLWTPQRDVGRATEKPAKHHHHFKSGTSGTSRGVRSGSVTRSGSLTSQGSSGSESGCEASFPVSVLKKQKRVSVAPKEVTSHRRMDQKKNVTFNAFATVQLVDD